MDAAQTEDASSKTKVLIIGAGPAGLFTACELLRYLVQALGAGRRFLLGDAGASLLARRISALSRQGRFKLNCAAVRHYTRRR
jgi:predicted flavoprotein YhiN